MAVTNSGVLLSVYLVLYLSAGSFANDKEELNLRCRQGEIRGKFLTTRGGREIRAFMSIPYAEPPVGKLRFEPPIPFFKWKGVLDATVIHDVCPQRNIYTRTHVIEGVEDCLYLNVYTPKKSETKGPLPVMMFLHGGGYLCGGGNIHWYGPDILLDRDVILVVPNYRLGALGFISTGDDVFPGNNGLKDQSLAIKWIFENIYQFGGDPNRITVFGESAGGAATHFHMMSPMSRDMVRSGISQSGTTLVPWSLAPPGEAKDNAHKLAKLLKCPKTSSQAIKDCLMKIKPYRLVELDKMFMDWDFDPMTPFKPVVEHDHLGAFLWEHPVDMMKSGKMPRIPWILGVTESEGALRAPGILSEKHLIDQINDDFEHVAPVAVMYKKTAQDVEGVTKAIREFYFGNKRIDRSTQKELVDMFSDGWFFNATDFAINLHLKYVKNDIYLYKFAHRGVASFTEIFGDPFNDYGVCHADDLQYLFPVGDSLFPEKKPDEADKEMAKHITTLWTNFAREGVPTIDGDKLPKWNKVQSNRLEYYHLEVPEKCHMDKDLFIERVKFWRTLDNNNMFVKDEL